MPAWLGERSRFADIDTMQEHEFKGKVILVTGAGRGIGKAAALEFARQGAIVAANDITPINLDKTVAEIKENGGTGSGYVFDVAKRMPVRALLDQVLDDWGRIDCLINNAAVQPRASILEMDEWDWQRTLDVNLSGPFYLMQQVGRIMREQGGGEIVNVAGTAGRAHGWQGGAAFTASKMGLLGLTREAARELHAYNIRVNAVCPGDLNDGSTLSEKEDHPLIPPELATERKGSPEEVARVILFLCSQAASHIIGQAINVDGGQLLN
jgi:NAD(P)-dependent dehydrogenase (short-subunit alcohol dehydrogenase family)